MKKILLFMLAITAMLLLSSCGSNSSGSAMLSLNVKDVRVSDRLQEEAEKIKQKPESERFNWEKEKLKTIESFDNLFTVLPGPYEFKWSEVQDIDNGAGNEVSETELKLRLRLNKTIKVDPEYANKTDEKEISKELSQYFHFYMLDADGKTSIQYVEEGDALGAVVFLNPKILWQNNGKIASIENTDGMLDFYHFLTSKPGTEFDLVISCGVQRSENMEKVLELNKGMKIIADFSQYHFYAE